VRRRTSARDVATRARLLEAAKRLFAERGFEDVTIREICREAKANLALVNYHFGDKLGLYDEVVNEAIAVVRQFNDRMMNAPQGSSPTERLAHFVRAILQIVFEQEHRHGWVHRLMEQEVSRPTAATTRIASAVVAPRIRYLVGVIAELLGSKPDDPRVLQCVASVHGLCLIYLRLLQTPAAFREAITEFNPARPLDAEAATAHVIAFSLAGIRAMRT
jgi:AcrR family transcriptional regulator